MFSSAPVATPLAKQSTNSAIDVAYAAAASPYTDLSGDVYGVLKSDKVPGGAAAVITDGGLTAIGANGKRVAGKKDKVTNDDRFHLGSAGKAMTSTMVARLIELGKIDWESKIVTVFPELKGKITKSFENVTVWQLMTNRSGLNDNVSAKTLIKLGRLGGTRQEQRAAMVPIMLSTAALDAPGQQFAYSNFGYAILGAMAERVTNTPFETLMAAYVFKPLGMDTAGFGPQGTDRKVYQPRGHDASGNAKTATNDDQLPYLAPAGTMSMSIVDWGKFLKSQMGLNVGKAKMTLVTASTLKRLHTPYDGPGQSYAAGWVVTKVLGVSILSHDGTNGNWYSTVQLIPLLKYAAFDVVNEGGSRGMQAAYDIKEKLLDRYPLF